MFKKGKENEDYTSEDEIKFEGNDEMSKAELLKMSVSVCGVGGGWKRMPQTTTNAGFID